MFTSREDFLSAYDRIRQHGELTPEDPRTVTLGVLSLLPVAQAKDITLKDPTTQIQVREGIHEPGRGMLSASITLVWQRPIRKPSGASGIEVHGTSYYCDLVGDAGRLTIVHTTGEQLEKSGVRGYDGRHLEFGIPETVLTDAESCALATIYANDSLRYALALLRLQDGDFAS
jgi:hypothetical protein